MTTESEESEGTSPAANSGGHRFPGWQLLLAVVAGTLVWTAMAQPWRAREGMFRGLQNRLSGNCPPLGNRRPADAALASDTAERSWTRLSQPPPVTFGYPMTTDQARREIVLFARPQYWQTPTLADLWRWNGESWNHLVLPKAPPPRTEFALAFDRINGVAMLTGGQSERAAYGDTWLWDGKSWNEKLSVLAPPRSRTAMAVDSLRGRVVLFGGALGTMLESCLQDTWEWNSRSWILRQPTQSPPARMNHAMAYDEARNRVVLFGGSTDDGGQGVFADTWEWDGVKWEDRHPATAPSPRQRHTMAFDPVLRQVVTLGGMVGARGGNPAHAMTDMWAWAGETWSELKPARVPPMGAGHGGLVLDPVTRGLTLFAGRPDRETGTVDRWAWDGRQWSSTPMLPGPRNDASVFHDSQRGRLVLFGGSYATERDDLWRWDGIGWTAGDERHRPPARSCAGIAYAPDTDTAVLFGGQTRTECLSDTWSFDGADWRECQPPGRPPPSRSKSPLAYDSVRHRWVMFGGFVQDVHGTSCHGDTWEFDGSAWTEHRPAHSPAARRGHGLAFDSRRGRTVLFGGWSSGWGDGVYRRDTWEWDGSDWRETPDPDGPLGREQPGMVFDEGRGVTVLFGGASCCSTWAGGTAGGRGVPGGLDDLWEWDGKKWRPVPVRAPAPALKHHSMVYDSTRRRIVVFGGSTVSGQPADMWALAPAEGR